MAISIVLNLHVTATSDANLSSNMFYNGTNLTARFDWPIHCCKILVIM